MFNLRQNCYCAFCGQPRKIYKLKRANVTHFLLSLLISILFMWAVWQRLEPRGILVFIVVQVAIEVVIHTRWRLSLNCRHCGFDPLLYLRDHNKAANKVKDYLERRRSDPRFLLAPALRIAKMSKQGQVFVPSTDHNKKLVVQKSNKGKLISKTI